MTIGDRLRLVRKSRQITLREVNAATGINYANLSEIERDEHGCTVETIKILADFYNVPIEYLLGYIDEITPQDISKEKPTITDDFDLIDLSIIDTLKQFSKDEKIQVLNYIKFLASQKEKKNEH